MRTDGVLLVLSLALAGCASGPPAVCRPMRVCSQASVSEAENLIPRELLFSDNDRGSNLLSPDGQKMVFRELREGSWNLMVQSVGRQDARPVADAGQARVFPWGFSTDSRWLYYLLDREGWEKWELRQVGLDGRDDRKIIELGFIGKYGMPILGHGAGIMLLEIRSYTRTDRGNKIAVRIDLRTGERKTVGRLRGLQVRTWRADGALQVRAALVKSKKDVLGLLIRDDEASEWRSIRKWTKEENVTLGPFSKDGKFLLIMDNKGSDTHRIFWLNLENGTRLDLFHDPKAEPNLLHRPGRGPEGVLVLDRELMAVATDDGRRKWHVIDQTVATDFEIFRKQAGEDFHIRSVSADRNRWLVTFNFDTRSQSTYLYERSSGRLTLQSVHCPGIDKYTFAEMHTVRIPTRDGLEMVSYLIRPPGKPTGKSPLVLLVHGGPEWRDFWGFDPWAQFLANRGYAVLKVNYRGSAGFGKAFLQAGKDNRLGGKTPDDLVDALNWAKQKAAIDPGRVAIMGFSYGGYAALAGLAFTPEHYVCGVDGFGVSSWLDQNRMQISSKRSLKHARKLVFDPKREKAKQGSPLAAADRIEAPLLVAHGSNDPRVKVEQSEEMVDEVRSAGGCVECVIYPDEGHGFRRQANRLDFATRLEIFLARHLCGRAQPPQSLPGAKVETY